MGYSTSLLQSVKSQIKMEQLIDYFQPNISLIEELKVYHTQKWILNAGMDFQGSSSGPKKLW